MDSVAASTWSGSFCNFNLRRAPSPGPFIYRLALRPFISHRFASDKFYSRPSRISISATSSSDRNPELNAPNDINSIAQTLKTMAGTLIFTAAASLMIAKFNALPARADTPSSSAVAAETDTAVEVDEITDSTDNIDENSEVDSRKSSEKAEYSPLSHLLESNSEFVSNLKSLLQKKLDNGEDEEALQILKKLVSAQPSNTEWQFLMARLLSEMKRTQEARDVFDEILSSNPLSFEALFENALLMDRCGERDRVIPRLELALRIAEDENKEKEARDVKLIIAQIQFLHKNVDEALSSYEELVREDPNDFRPYFCKGMIYSLLDQNDEAREEFAKYRKLSPKKFEVDGYLRTPLSRMKLFGTGSDN